MPSPQSMIPISELDPERVAGKPVTTVRLSAIPHGLIRDGLARLRDNTGWQASFAEAISDPVGGFRARAVDNLRIRGDRLRREAAGDHRPSVGTLHDAESHADSELRADTLAYGAMCWELGADAMGTDPRAGRTWLLEAARAYGSVFDATDDPGVREHGSFLSSLVLIQIASTQHSQLPAMVAQRALKKLVKTSANAGLQDAANRVLRRHFALREMG